MKSIVHFCKSIGVDIEGATFEILKKQIALEFKTSSTGILTFDGYEYDLDYVLNELMQNDFVNLAKFEKQFNSIKWISVLLDVNKKIEERRKTYTLPIELDKKEFREFFGDKILSAFKSKTKHLIQQKDYVQLYRMSFFTFFLNEDDYQEAFENVSNWIASGISLFKNVNHSNYDARITEIKEWCKPGIGECVNMLPEEFAPKHEGIAAAIFNFVISIYSENETLAIALCDQIIKIYKISKELKNSIKETTTAFKNRREFRQIMKSLTYESPIEKVANVVRIIVLIILALLILHAAFT